MADVLNLLASYIKQHPPLTNCDGVLSWNSSIKKSNNKFNFYLRSWFRGYRLRGGLSDSLQKGPSAILGRAPNGACLKLKAEARSRVIETKKRRILDEEQLATIHEIFQDLNEDSFDEKSLNHAMQIGYESFCEAGKKIEKKLGKKLELFRPSTFLQFSQDDRGRINTEYLYGFIERQSMMDEMYVSISSFDRSETGAISREDFCAYLKKKAVDVPRICKLGRDDQANWVLHSCSKIFFLLDVKHSGRVLIHQIVHSNPGKELLKASTGLSPQEEKTNWFSEVYSKFIHGLFLKLDENRVKSLSRSNLYKFNERSLCPAFVDRVFEEHVTGGRMTYESFLDFMVAMTWKKAEASINFYWRILDVDKRGYLTIANVNFFFKDIMKSSQERGNSTIEAGDVVDQIFDMIKPRDPTQITLKDLKDSGVSRQVFSLLTDVNGFWRFNEVESLPSEGDNDGTY
ncbi:serine/threonine-protein phosphatase 2A regulatory subunit B'' subunit gamma-like [Planoprotostelium fungivorum]|uniref:Serine/threonine-protein phosphatase 2A regulatory subunit B'' subunit gamma-like n=1 Tax=Planoprotostelium fungivorum TaxID=1890364 RepID=A0A2P6MRZ8_9EUKA|nr:serine/threonine-protein phosphatase 2A regulatory subunit B'' subunit gamma-like [Planoprotostelium fungivorum]